MMTHIDTLIDKQWFERKLNTLTAEQIEEVQHETEKERYARMLREAFGESEDMATT